MSLRGQNRSVRRVAFIPAMGSRYDVWVPRLLQSIKETRALRGWEIMLLAQGFSGTQKEDLQRLPQAVVLTQVDFVGESKGPLEARAECLRRFGPADLWLSLDDDMLLTAKSDYASRIWQSACMEPGVGLIRCRQDHHRHDTTLREQIVLDPIMASTGGGFMFSGEVAQEILEIKEENCACDNCAWSMRLYLNGRRHYAYLGSYTIHRGGSPNGLNKWLGERRRLPYPEFVNYRMDATRRYEGVRHSTGRYHWPRDSDVNQEARKIHHRAARANGWSHPPMLYPRSGG